MKNTHSIYPNGIDSRVYAQDINIENVSIINDYQSLLAQGEYPKASALLNNSDAYFYGAWMLNLLENRLNLIGKNVMEMIKPKLTIYQSEEPEGEPNGMVWIGDDLEIKEEK